MDTIIPQNDTPQKQCKGPCGQFFPATLDHFHKAKENRDRLSNICKQCAKKANRAKYLLAKANPPEVPPGALIVCSVCKKPKPATEDFFGRDPRNTKRYGFTSDCKPCKIETARERNKAPERKASQRASAKKHYHTHPERCRTRRRRYYYANKEIENERNRIYCHAHHAERNQQRRIYRHTHPGSRKGEEQNRRAHKKAVPGTHTPAQIQEQLKRQHYRCYYAACGFSKFKKVKGQYIYVVEHTFPLSRVVGTNIPANDMSYLVLACPKCNGEKYDKFPWEWPAGGRLL